MEFDVVVKFILQNKYKSKFGGNKGVGSHT
jgi:hypothetical protein